MLGAAPLRAAATLRVRCRSYLRGLCPLGTATRTYGAPRPPSASLARQKSKVLRLRPILSI
jgi:hypothetical protein